MMTQEHLKSVLAYDPETGVFTWLVSPSPKVRAGMRAGSIRKTTGYWNIQVSRKYYLASRLAHFYMTGSWPVAEMDHRDCNSTNDAWDNLRPATRSQNLINRPAGRRTRLRGTLKGACFIPQRNRWRADLRYAGCNKHLGYFDTEQEAHEAYVLAAREIHGEFARAA